MILHRLRARDFMRFRELVLDNLPETGMIGVFGPNESGKSTLGECLSFALFGRTEVETAEAEGHELVRWDADGCDVELVFTSPGRGVFRVHRTLSRDGAVTAQLQSLPDRDADEGESVARGTEQVNRALGELTRFSFEEYRRSFYLRQKEFEVVREVGHDREFVRRLLGVDLLLEQAEQAEAEAEPLEQRLTGLRVERDSLEGLVEATGVDPDEEPRYRRALDTLAEEMRGIESSLKELATRREALDDAGAAREALEEELPRWAASARRRLADQAREEAADALGALETGLRRAREARDRAREALEERTAVRDAARALRDGLGEVVAAVREREREVRSLLQPQAPDAGDETPAGRRNRLAATAADCRDRAARRRTGAGLLTLTGAVATATAVADLVGPGSMGPEWLPPAAWTAGGVLLGGAGLAWWLAAADRRQARECDDALPDLDRRLSELRTELERCESFDPPTAAAAEEALAGIDAPAARTRLDDLRARHGERWSLDPHAALRDMEEDLAAAESAAAAAEDTAERWEAAEGDAARARTGPAAVQATAGTAPDEDDDPADLAETAADAAARVVELEGAAGRDAPPADREAELRRTLREHLDVLVATEPDVQPLRTHLGAPPAGANAVDRALATAETALPSTAEIESRLDACERERAAAEEKRRDLEKRRQTMADEFENYLRLLGKRKDLEARCDAVARDMEGTQREARVRRTLGEMLRATASAIQVRMGPNLSRFMGALLGRITDGRYTSVRVGDDFSVRVFSSERNGFVPLSSLSGGTVDQMLLALRLAFAQALVQARVGPGHRTYLFLDEPLSAFDRERAERFLELLRDMSRNFAQVFVVSHLPGLEAGFAAIIRTDMDAVELEVDAAD